jgi:hypothetical protein
VAKHRRNHLLWIGPLLTFAGGVSYYTVFATYPTLRDFPWINLPAVWLGLILSIVGVVRAFSPRAAYRGKVLGSIGLLFSAALTGLFTLYIFVFSYMLPQPTDVAAPQTIAPDFTLADQHGRSVSLSELRGRNVVIVFYRGHW